MNWLDQHQPLLGFGSDRSMLFESQHCLLNCLQPCLRETVYEKGAPESETRPPTARGSIDVISARAALAMARVHPDSIVWVEPHDWDRLLRPPRENVAADTDDTEDDCNAEAF
ncbi:hypothetical protein DM02DRAFT_483418, partial [Periconia macrospinosa]